MRGAETWWWRFATKMSDLALRGEPGIVTGLASLLQKLNAGATPAEIIQPAAVDANTAQGLMELSVMFQFLDNHAMHLDLQAKALQLCQHYRLAVAGDPAGIRLLAILRPGGMLDNTPLEFLLQQGQVTLDVLYLGMDLPMPTVLPPHDLIFVAMAPSDQALLARTADLLQRANAPVLNAPAAIASLSREIVSQKLVGIPGLVIPRTARVSRQTLLQLMREEKSVSAVVGEGDFPIIVRPTDSHAGRGLARLETPATLMAYLEDRAEDEFHVARFVDYSTDHGLYQKCRLVLIAGQAYAVHLAVAEHWMVHYGNAGMSESAARRLAEEQFLNGFTCDFIGRHGVALREVGARLQLDYLVIDCAETADGQLLLFEADNIGFVHAFDPPDIFPYKQPHLHKLFDAFESMLAKAMRQIPAP